MTTPTLAAGSDEGTRKAAAQQITDIARNHPEQLPAILRKVRSVSGIQHTTHLHDPTYEPCGVILPNLCHPHYWMMETRQEGFFEAAHTALTHL